MLLKRKRDINDYFERCTNVDIIKLILYINICSFIQYVGEVEKC